MAKEQKRMGSRTGTKKRKNAALTFDLFLDDVGVASIVDPNAKYTIESRELPLGKAKTEQKVPPAKRIEFGRHFVAEAAVDRILKRMRENRLASDDVNKMKLRSDLDQLYEAVQAIEVIFSDPLWKARHERLGLIFEAAERLERLLDADEGGQYLFEVLGMFFDGQRRRLYRFKTTRGQQVLPASKMKPVKVYDDVWELEHNASYSQVVAGISRLVKAARYQRQALPITLRMGTRISPFEWLVSKLLASIYQSHFKTEATLTRAKGDPPRGPFLDFVMSVFDELQIGKPDGEPYTIESIASALYPKGVRKRRKAVRRMPAAPRR